MKLFKDYSQELDNIQVTLDIFHEGVNEKIDKLEEEIKEIKTGFLHNKVLLSIADIQGNMTAMQQQYDVIQDELAEIKQLLSNQEPTGLVKEEINIAKSNYKVNDEGKRHISTYTQFETYALPRYYDLSAQKFFIVRSRGGANVP